MNSGPREKHPLQHYYSRIYKTYDLVNRLFTFGLDRRWRKVTAKECLAGKPGKILDLCCGTGDLALLLMNKATYPVEVTGYDLNEGMLSMAEKKASGIKNGIRFIRGDAGNMPFGDGEFKAITIGFGFRNLTWENPNRKQHLSEINRVLAADGKLFILESSKPKNRLIRFFYYIYLRTILIAIGGLLSGDWSAYRYLAGSSAGFYSFKDISALLMPYSLTPVLRKRFLFGSANLIVASKQ